MRPKVHCHPNQQYNFITGVCDPVQYMTSPDEPHLIITAAGGYQSYVKAYTKAKKANPKLQPCPLATPFYQKSASKCISCPKSSPYFDITADSCAKCSFSKFYSPLHHNCVPQTKVPYVPSTVSRIGY